MTTETKRTAPKLADMMKAFNPYLTDKQIAERVKMLNVKVEIVDVTPKGYGPTE